MSKKQYRTDFLFPHNGFLVGMGNTLNISGNYYAFGYSSSEEEADSRAIENDWGVVGQDIIHVVGETPFKELQIG